MLAIADADGIVSAAIPGLASVANVSVEAAEKAVKNLESPDPYSRTKDFEGRRIEVADGGWRILNYVKYRRMLSEEERREYKAKWIKDKRRQMSTKSTDVDAQRQMSTSVSASSSASKKKGESEGDWIQGLKTDPAYKGIDVQREHYKMIRWCKENKQQPSRRRFVRWLNRIDKPMQTTDKVKPLDKSTLPVAPEFTEWALKQYPAKVDEIRTWKTWAEVPQPLRSEWYRDAKSQLTDVLTA